LGSAEVNGVRDDPFIPKMPFRVQLNGYEDRWEITIDLDRSQILNWPNGTTAKVWYDVLDDGMYYLLDEDKITISVYDGYVPNGLGSDTTGDSICLSVTESGYIKHISAPKIVEEFHDISQEWNF
jgi:hypothetical protein